MSSIFIYPPTNGQSGGGGNGNVTVVDNLTSTSSTDALSAFQGNVLDKKITAQSDSFDLKLTEQSTTINNTINEKVTELNTKIEEQSLKVASTTQLGNVKIDGDSIKIREDGTIYVDKIADNAIFEIHELLLPTTQDGQTQWEIPSQYYTNGDTLIVTYNSVVLDSNMYSLDSTTGATLLTIPDGTGVPIANNQVYLFIFHNKLPDPNFTIYQKVLQTTMISQKTWTIDIPTFDSTKDSIMVIHNTTVLTNSDYSITGNILTIPNNTIEEISKNTVSVIVFSNSQPMGGGNYTLPIASTNILGGIKPDGVTLNVDPSTGVASVVGGGSFNFKQQALTTTEISQSSWIIPFSDFNKDKDLLIVSHNTVLLPTNLYTVTNDGTNNILTLLFNVPSAIEDNNVFLIFLKGGGSDSSNVNISAKNVTETVDRVFVTSNQKAQIDANTSENLSQTNRISTLENTVSNLSTTDEKVKMDVNGVASYLSELIDGITVVNTNGKLQIKGIDGLMSTLSELNALQGISSNVQQQINNLSGVSTFRGVFTSLAQLQALPNPQAGEYAIVSENGMSDYYFYYGTNWDFSHSSTGVSIIDINSNTSGTLSKSRYEKQNASETPFVDANGNITSTNTNDAILEVFRFADSLLKELKRTVGLPLLQTDSLQDTINKFKIWWSDLANSITSKGVITSSSNNGEEILQKIYSIPNISLQGTINKKSKINITAPYNLELILENPISISDVTATLIEFVQGSTGVVHYDLDFDNGDSSNFIPNDNVEFDGVLKIRSNYSYDMIKNQNWTNEGSVFEYELNKSNYSEINNMVVEY